MKIIEKLKQFNVEITPEMEKAFAGEFLSELEVDKKLSKLQTENETLKNRAEKAEETLKGFEGKDFEAMQKEVETWKETAEQAKAEYETKMAEHEKAELLKNAMEGIEFTSESARKAITAQIAEGVSVKNGKLIGFNDLLEEAKNTDASAFVDKEQQNLEQNKAKFTTPNTKVPQPGKKLGIAELMKLKNENPNLDISQYM